MPASTILKASLRWAPARYSMLWRLNRSTVTLSEQRRFCSHEQSAIIPSEAQKASPQDHHVLGKRLNLFSSTPYSTGSPLLHVDGSHIFLKLQALLRSKLHAFGFREVISPVIYKQALWEKSGHWENYSDDMFEVTGKSHKATTQGDAKAEKRTQGHETVEEDERWGLKPMNCPGHCLLFATEARSYRDLPVRYADFSPLHRNEISGALTGLTRVRRFHQDDGHIFCKADQVRDEIASTLKMVNQVYSVFGLRPYKLLLSTRPETSYLGKMEDWDDAESQLRSALDDSGLSWSLNPGDGAFYGPKIDIILRDNHGKEHQTATIQLDFQLPKRFQLEYHRPDSSIPDRPILIHRAVLGSLERFMALLIEHYGGKWPFWLNPKQVTLITVNDKPEVLRWANDAAQILRSAGGPSETQSSTLREAQFMVDIDSDAEKVNRKIFHARDKGYSIACVIGAREVETKTLAATIHCAGDGDRLLKIEEIICKNDASLLQEDWKKQRKINVDPRILREIMIGIEHQWL